MSLVFEKTTLNSLTLRNRFVRSATWAGMAGEDGQVTPPLLNLMQDLAAGGVGVVITGHAYVTLVNMVVLIAVNLLLLLWLVPSYGLIGAAVATAIAYVLVTLWRVTQARRLLGINPLRREHFNVILLFAATFLIAWAGAFPVFSQST